MSDARLGTVVRHLHQLAVAPPDELTDACLLRRYAADHDADAFALIVRRHGPLVWRVCRRVLGSDSDAEDCFQATFLVLARRAGAIRKPGSLTSWLHGVAFRVARTAQARLQRQSCMVRTERAATTAEPANEAAWRELAAMVEEEVHALPEPLRLAVLTCYWQGLSNEEAAQQLGWPTGTVKTRLAKARAVLHRRLSRRGVTLPVGTIVVLLAPSGAQATLPATLASASLLTAKTLAACTGAPVAMEVATRADAVIGTALPAKAKIACTVLLMCGLAIASAAAVTKAWRAPVTGDDPPPAFVAQPAKDAPEPPRQDAQGDALPLGAIARLGSLRFNHGGRVHGFHFAPDGKTIVSIGSGSLCLWDAATGKERARIATDGFGIGAPSLLLPDGKTLLILCQQTDTLQTWDLEMGKQTRKLVLPTGSRGWSAYQHYAIAADGRRCMTHTDSQIKVWDTAGGKELFKLPEPGETIRAATFAGNDHIVAVDKKQLVTIWDVRSGKQVRQFAHGSPVEVLATSPDGRWLATLAHHTHAIDRLLDKDAIALWDLTTGTRKHTLIAAKSWYMGVQFSPDGASVLAYRYGDHESGLTVWDVESGRQVRELPTGGAWAMTPDGRSLVAGGVTFSVWDMATGQQRREEASRRDLTSIIHLSATGDRVLTLGYSSFTTWDVATGKPLRTTQVPKYFLLPPYRCCSPDGRYVVTFRAGGPKQIDLLIWDVAAGKLLHSLRPADAPQWPLSTTAFAPDGSLLATYEAGKDGVVRLWDVRSGQQVRAFKDTKNGWGGPLAFSGDGRTLFITGRRVVAFDVATGAERLSWRVQPPPSTVGKAQEVGGPPANADDQASWRALAFAPDASVAAGVLSADVMPNERVKDRLALCDARTGKFIRRWSDSGKNSSDWEQVVFADDGRLLATSDGHAVHVWEVATGSKLVTLHGHRDEIVSLSFSSGGWRLASASRDTTALIWDLALALSGPAAAKETPAALAACWDDLASPDASRAYAAIARLAANPGAAVAMLDKRLKPVTPAEVQEIRRCIAELDSDEFAQRDAAYQRLAALGPSPVHLLRQALEKKVAVETRRRIEQLLDNPASRPAASEPLRTLRALTALERAATPEARRVLETLAGGGADAWLTLAAQAASKRLR